MDNNSSKERVKDILIAVLSIVLIAYLVLGMISISKGEKFGFFNLRFYIVSSEINNGEANTGDLIISTNIKEDKVKANDEIVFKRNNKIDVKKVVKGNDNKLYIETSKNQYELNDIEVQGKVIGRAKGLGNIAMFLKSPIGIVNLLLIALCVLIIIKKISDNNKKLLEDCKVEDKKTEITDENNDKN